MRTVRSYISWHKDGTKEVMNQDPLEQVAAAYDH
jgi:hypothetical protein